MSTSPLTRPRQIPNAYLIGVVVFALVAVVGLYLVKWNPYYHKAFVAAARHSIGTSIVSGKAAAPPAASWAAAWGYFVAYWNAIWQALVEGLLLGSAVQVLIPKQWLLRVLGKAGFKTTALGGLAAVPGMM